jgi:hypothetical protein
MNQPYRVRIKTKVKLRFGLLIIVFSVALYYLLRLDFGLVPDKVKYGNIYLLKPISQSSSGSYRGMASSSFGKFKLPSSKIISASIYRNSYNGFYCVAEVLINGKVSSYHTVKYEQCV